MLLLRFFTGTWISAGPFCGFSISLEQCNKRENLKRQSLKGTLDYIGLTRSLIGLIFSFKFVGFVFFFSCLLLQGNQPFQADELIQCLICTALPWDWGWGFFHFALSCLALCSCVYFCLKQESCKISSQSFPSSWHQKHPSPLPLPAK